MESRPQPLGSLDSRLEAWSPGARGIGRIGHGQNGQNTSAFPAERLGRDFGSTGSGLDYGAPERSVRLMPTYRRTLLENFIRATAPLLGRGLPCHAMWTNLTFLDAPIGSDGCHCLVDGGWYACRCASLLSLISQSH